MTQTAVEWLEHIYLTTGINRNVHFNQAKIMEKQEIMEFVYSAIRNILNEDRQKPFNLEQYYNETYGSKGSDDHIVDTNEMVSSQTEISDEEIEKAARDYDNGNIYGPPLVNFEQGAFWYREQLKK